MDIFRIGFDEKILLVGEGNFSFSVGFMKLNNHIFSEGSCLERSVEIISTCFESEGVSCEFKQKNCDYLEQKGCTVLHSVDATNLSGHSVIGSKKFTKIIFNFPHVGGKMKIHLNRKLLADFFSSAKYVLDESGVVLLTLCDGQGGTGKDKIQRRWDDSWKVVEMAGEADFILINVIPFEHCSFPDYMNVGYRSLQKGFNINNALVHVFRLCEPPSLINFSENEIQSLFKLHTLPSPFGNLSISTVHARKIFQDPFNSLNSPQKYLYDCFTRVSFTKRLRYCEENFIYGNSCKFSSAEELIGEHYLNLGSCNIDSIVIFKGILLNELTENFENPPVTCEVNCMGESSSVFSEKVILELLKDFKFSKLIVSSGSSEITKTFYIDGLTKFEICRVKKCVVNDKVEEICTVHLDNIARSLFCLSSWQELWAEGSQIKFGDKIAFQTPCIFPCTYVFDLSFSTCESFSESNFFNILWHLAENIIFHVQLISVYKPLNKNVTNFCYRIKYKSYKLPLHRKRVIDIQRNVIGKTLERMLGVVIL